MVCHSLVTTTVNGFSCLPQLQNIYSTVRTGVLGHYSGIVEVDHTGRQAIVRIRGEAGLEQGRPLQHLTVYIYCVDSPCYRQWHNHHDHHCPSDLGAAPMIIDQMK